MVTRSPTVVAFVPWDDRLKQGARAVGAFAKVDQPTALGAVEQTGWCGMACAHELSA